MALTLLNSYVLIRGPEPIGASFKKGKVAMVAGGVVKVKKDDVVIYRGGEPFTAPTTAAEMVLVSEADLVGVL